MCEPKNCNYRRHSCKEYCGRAPTLSTFNFYSTQFCKTGMKAIVDTAKDDIMKLKGDDVMVIWGGSNDI